MVFVILIYFWLIRFPSFILFWIHVPMVHWSGGRALAAEVDGPWSLHDTQKNWFQKGCPQTVACALWHPLQAPIQPRTQCIKTVFLKNPVSVFLSLVKKCLTRQELAILPPQPPGVGIAAVGHGEFEQVFSWLIKRTKQEHCSDVKSKRILSSN